MISWIQNTFQHHFRIVFGLLLALLIVAFVFTIGAAPGIGQADRKAPKRPFFGLNLGSERDQQRLVNDASLSIFLQAGYQALEGGQTQEYALKRQAALALADQLNLPQPTQDEIRRHVEKLRAFAGENGQFDPKRYSEFRDNIGKNSSINESEVLRVISEDVRAERVQQLLGGPGYVLPFDVRNQLQRLDASWTIAVASIDYKSFSPAIKPTDADLEKFFTENAFRYEVPPHVRVDYAEFSASAFLPAVTVTPAEVRAYYDVNPARFPKPEVAGKAPSVVTGPDADFAAVRPQVELELKAERASRLAAKAASDFTYALYEQKISPGTPEFEALLAARKITLKSIPPFSQEQPPAALPGAEVVEEAFRLSKDRPYSDPIAAATGSVVLFWKESIPARQPLLAEVKAQVSADYVENEKRRRFVELGRTLRSQIERRIKAGDKFEQAATAAAAASGVKIETKTHPAFTLRQRPQDLDYLAFNALGTLEKGGLSEMVVGPDSGKFVYAIDKTVPDASESDPQYKTVRTQIAQLTANRSSNDYLRELVERELARATPVTETP